MKNLIFLLVAVLFFACGNPKSVSVQSPDGRIKVDFWIDELADNYYSVSYNSETLVRPSFIGYLLEDGQEVGTNMEIVSFSEMEVS
ncbi:MAG: glycoside hydrolase family 97 N-terminal domain-containing protein [Prolixibacteraceae bacterium]|nr:glycoside hydrolase family 97 N-terminal domain-containing protein [Prolixibacteraceae bacterium]